MNSETACRTIDAEIWKLYKHFNIADNFPVIECANFIYDNLKPAISHESILERLQTIHTYRRQLKFLMETPQVKQRSPEWFEMRTERLTASSTAQAIGKGKFGNRNQLLQSKAFPENETWTAQTSGPMYHGTMLEAMTSRCYSQRNNDMVIHDFGMIKHPDLYCYGASPDGITELGIMIEIKTPYRRVVDGKIPEEYMLQMQGQMAACGFKECEFVDCKIDIIQTESAYTTLIDANLNVDHGIIIEHRDEKGNPIFEYSPEYLTPTGCIQWKKDYQQKMLENKDTRFTKITYWKLHKIIATHVNFNQELWDNLVPQIKQFWEDVLTLRKNPPAVVSTKKTTSKSSGTKNNEASSYNFIDSDED